MPSACRSVTLEDQRAVGAAEADEFDSATSIFISRAVFAQ